jgi:hypothetical protein
MELTLRFEGELPAATSSNNRVREKHQIRQELHSQLAVFWSQHPVLIGVNANLKSLQIVRRVGDRFEVDRPIIGNRNFRR